MSSATISGTSTGRWLAYLAMATAMATVGSTVVVSEVLSESLPVFFAALVRFAVSTPLLVLAAWRAQVALPRLSWRDWAILLLQAGAGSVGFTVLLIAGMRLSTAADAGVLVGTLPAVASALSIVVLGDRPSLLRLSGIALATVGVLLLSLEPSTEFGHTTLETAIGYLLVLGAVTCEAMFTLLNKALRVSIPPIMVATLMSAISLALVVVPGIVQGLQDPAVLSETNGLLACVYYGVVPTFIGFFLWYSGTARVTGTEASLFMAVMPVSAVVLAVLVLGEPLLWGHFAGGGAVLAAIVVGAYAAQR